MTPVGFDSEYAAKPFHRIHDQTGLDPVCMSLKFQDGYAITACPSLFGHSFREVLMPYLTNPDLQFIAHNIAAERAVLKTLDLPMPSNWADTLLISRTLDIAQIGTLYGSYNLLALCEKCGLPVRDTMRKKYLQELIGEGRFAPADLPEIVAYCEADAADTLAVFQSLESRVSKLSAHMQKILWEVMHPVWLKVIEISACGVQFDWRTHGKIRQQRDEVLPRMQHRLRKAGVSTDFYHSLERLTAVHHNLPLCALLHDLGIRTDHLEPYKQDLNKFPWKQRLHLTDLFKNVAGDGHEFLKLVAQYHECIEIMGRDWTQFVDGDDCIRPAVSFPGTSSYRIQQFKPNPLMLSYNFRPLVTARPGHVLVEGDYKAQEFLLMGAIYKDPALLTACNDTRADIYTKLLSDFDEYPLGLDGLPIPHKGDSDLESKRGSGKTGLLALGYGGGNPAVMKNLHCDRDRSSEFIGKFRKKYLKLFENRERYLDETKRRGFAQNKFGLERRWIPRLMGGNPSDLSFQNFPVQSCGSMILWQVLLNMPSDLQPVLLAHDGILFECRADDVEAPARIKKLMIESATALFPECVWRVPSPSSGGSWFKDNPDSMEKFCKAVGIEL